MESISYSSSMQYDIKKDITNKEKHMHSGVTPYHPLPGMVISIELLKENRNCRLEGWPITVVEVPFYEQAQRDFHSHDGMEIGIVTEGQGVHIMDGKRVEIHAGDVLLIPPGHQHGYDAIEEKEIKRGIFTNKGVDYEVPCVPMSIVNILYDHRKLPIPLLDGQNIPLYSFFFPNEVVEMTYETKPIMNISDPSILEFIRFSASELHKEEVYPYTGNLFGSTIRLLSLVLMLLRNGNINYSPNDTTVDTQFGNVLAFVNANYAKGINVAELAKMSFISKSQLQKKFKKYTGLSISDYVMRKRIETAKMLLKKGMQPIQEIAFDCGFNDFSFFAKKFREITGTTPRDYRNGKSDGTTLKG